MSELNNRRPMVLVAVLLSMTFALGLSACKADEKPDEKKAPESQQETAAADEPAAQPSAEPTETAEAEQPAAAEAPAAQQYVKVIVDHHNPEQGPVEATFSGFELVGANFDFANPAEAWAEFKVSPLTFASDNLKRDEHVKSADFLNAESFPAVTFRVHSLTPVEGTPDAYTATATLDLIGVKRDVPVEFRVVDKADDGSVTVEGTGSFKRSEFSLGKTPEEANVADDIKVDVRLVVANTEA